MTPSNPTRPSQRVDTPTPPLAGATGSPILAWILAFALGGAIAASPTSAQTFAAPGDRVRVHSSGGDTIVEGRLLALSGAGLSYQQSGGGEIRLEPAGVRALEVRRVKRHWGLGFTLGAAAGATYGWLEKPTDRDRECKQDPCDQTFGDNNERFMSGVAGAALGGLAGSVVGWLFKSESWEPVIVPWSSDGSSGAELGGRIRF